MKPDIKSKLAELDALERQWASEEYMAGRTADEHNCFMWQPWRIYSFAEMLYAALNVAAPNPSFLDPAAGIGTKCVLATVMGCGWRVTAIDPNKRYIEQARALGIYTLEGRAEEYGGYGQFDIVYTSHPFMDEKQEREYEAMVQDRMRPGAVLIAAWCSVKPDWPCYDRRSFAGVWRKPLPGEKWARPAKMAPYPGG